MDDCVCANRAHTWEKTDPVGDEDKEEECRDEGEIQICLDFAGNALDKVEDVLDHELDHGLESRWFGIGNEGGRDIVGK